MPLSVLLPPHLAVRAPTRDDLPAIFALIQASDLKHSVGVALLRFITTFGTLSLDYAYPLTQTVAEERWKTNPWYTHYPGKFHLNWGIPLSRN